MAAQNTSTLLPSVKCDFEFKGFRPDYGKQDPARVVTLTITIERDKKSGELPIQADHPVRVTAWIKRGRAQVLVFEEPEKPLKEYYGGQQGRIQISGFRLLPFTESDDWHDLVVKFTPKGHQTSMYKQSFKWDGDKIFPWFRDEITSISRDAYNSNQKFLTKMSDIIRWAEMAYHDPVIFDRGKDTTLQTWMRHLQQNVEEVMVKIEKLGGRTAIRAYTNVPKGKTVKPIGSSFLCTVPIFEKHPRDPPVCLQVGHCVPIIITVNFDGLHSRGPVPEIWAYLVQTQENETGPIRKSKTDKVMYKSNLGPCLIWFNDRTRRDGLIYANDDNVVKLTDQDKKLKTGRYYLTIGIKSPGWTENITRISNNFILNVPPDSGQGESST